MLFTTASIFHNIYEKWNNALQEHSHPYTKDWFLANPAVIFSIISAWLFFCLYAGPRFMKNRKPYQLKNTLIVHNLVAIVLSAFVFIEGGRYGWFSKYDWKCEPVEHPDDPVVPYTTAIVWVYLLAKLLDLLDTVLFVLRKKQNQVTTLHVYHHSIMPIFGWVAVRFIPGGHGTLIGWLNSFVHVVMYSYYLIACLGPEYQKYLWWKKHVTHLQLIQFIIIFFHNFTVLFRNCSYPRFWNYCGVAEATIFLYMFGKFYYNSYVKNYNKHKIKSN